MTKPLTRLSELPTVSMTISGHWRDDGSALCPWSRTRVTRLITACPNGCSGAVLIRDEPTIGLSDVVTGIYESVSLHVFAQQLNLLTSDGDWIDAVRMTGHPTDANILIIEMIRTGQLFTLTINETR